MFGNRSFKVKFTKDPVVVDKETKVVVIHPNWRRMAMTAGSLYAAKALVDTTQVIALSKIAK